MRLNDFGRNIRVRDQRRSGGGLGGGLGGGGKLGCGAVVVAIIGAVVFGIDPSTTLATFDQVQGGMNSQSAPTGQDGGQTLEQSCTVNAYSLESCAALSSLDDTWQPLFMAANLPFRRPVLNFYDGTGGSGCGTAQAAMGPFYCPADEGIYIDTSFYDDLQGRFGAGGDFARAYVMAHEYGHHVQKLTGIADQVRSAQSQDRSSANQLQVRMELQADCYAGVWAARNRDRIEPGDLDEGMRAAAAIGDDTLMRNAGQRMAPESFTHGTSAQRTQWLQRGLTTGDEDQCDTFADLRR
ncbi:neutral zinc metallopeptidase [Croceicoccus sp. F390]|uniref:Neutral zinc metallopeptidase n=1 Tax=Croceicoccus esteveae TaxID=3075597 RepID=A0ABU2ZHI6_9SPHN|nr:neutral zinc metallopeptidase [Croceicoccus sp. F390]MDT0574877.1 neutral zinc metallopeptidase [Croceicoccus sp. F390]